MFGKLSAVVLPMVNSFFQTAGIFDATTAVAVTTAIGILGIVPLAFARETGKRAVAKAEA